MNITSATNYQHMRGFNPVGNVDDSQADGNKLLEIKEHKRIHVRVSNK